VTLDPRLFGSTPYGNPTAFLDLQGQLYFFHVALARKLGETGESYGVLPIGSGPGGPTWLRAVQQTYANAARAVGIAAPPDLQTYDLSDAEQFASWTFEVGQFSKTLAVAAGLP